jgi:LysR family glycine cleavage system transcriptional activator
MGDTDWEETTNERLFDIKLVPVCSPALLERIAPLRGFDDLKRLTLLHSLARSRDWEAWGIATAADLDGHTQLQFESSSLAYEAALGGVGVAMGQLALVLDDLKSGRLVMPFPTVHSDRSWVALSARRDFVRSSMYLEFRGWIREEAAKFIEDQDAFCATNALQLI